MPINAKEIFVMDMGEEIALIHQKLEPYIGIRLPKMVDYRPLLIDYIQALVNKDPLPCFSEWFSDHLPTDVANELESQVKDMVLGRFRDTSMWDNSTITADIWGDYGTSIVISTFHRMRPAIDPMVKLQDMLRESMENGDYIPERLRALL